ncbi:hypothetical protein GTA08_BOTSDO08011 [Neofusicoccum parvum]|nr:hypothetical protein GTA08_BOTSDO08011 [Neofusicoccum parvum]
MGILSNRPTLTALLTLFAITGLFYYTSCASPASPLQAAIFEPEMPPAPPRPSHLALSVRQTATSPPTLALALTNTHPSSPLTLLVWDSPLDPLALQLGLVEITPAGAGAAPLPLPSIKVSRLLPPGEDALVTLAPGEVRERELVLREPVVPWKEVRGGKARVVVRGRWRAVWEGEGVGREAVEGMEGAMTGEWEGEVEVVVEG